MSHNFKVGDPVEWNSEAGRVRGTIKKKIVSKIAFKGYTVNASKEWPQYLIKSDKTEHLAMHKGTALKEFGESATDSKHRDTFAILADSRSQWLQEYIDGHLK